MDAREGHQQTSIAAGADLVSQYPDDGEVRDSPELLKLIGFGAPAWHRDAACKEHPELSWFRREDLRPVKRVCKSCLVSNLCRAWALSQPEPLVGIWGGLTENERRKLRAGPATPQSSTSDPTPPRVLAAGGSRRPNYPSAGSDLKIRV
jgi:hypothetical protein